MNQTCKEYLRQVGRAMGCPRAERKRLLSGFEHELEEVFPDGTAPAMDELTARFGTPETLAAELQRALPENAAANYQMARRRRWMAATAACLIVIALLVGFLFWLKSIDVYVPPQDEEIIYGTHYVIEEDNP